MYDLKISIPFPQSGNGFVNFPSIQTGTLTENTLDMAGVTESQGAQFKTMVSEPVTMRLDSRLVQGSIHMRRPAFFRS